MDESFETVRDAFGAAARWFAETVHELDRPPAHWEAPALGEWSRRDLDGSGSTPVPVSVIPGWRCGRARGSAWNGSGRDGKQDLPTGGGTRAACRAVRR